VWWADLLWGFWNGLTAWIVHVFGGWEQLPSYNAERAASGTTSGSCSALVMPSWAPAAEGGAERDATMTIDHHKEESSCR
jgi:hypothetical protein